ncbi:hypothetical protein SAMN05216419_105311 [Nitrosomonas cryotolerans]|uniref:Uncharacterized protein n=1 Tax=Nitrosomonas cryotolerans ATCC 49181 TaxID=1131553 RepID=A0A1N6GAN2_9PROT|nr:hypothetical protein SAMN05216419_105311 [Nitrosomonas cryotolerans]SIO04537.1 hypothetical protein SAMN02743940_0624 [Nitrosomonas cryotolerans ATCC 49181]
MEEKSLSNSDNKFLFPQTTRGEDFIWPFSGAKLLRLFKVDKMTVVRY